MVPKATDAITDSHDAVPGLGAVEEFGTSFFKNAKE